MRQIEIMELLGEAAGRRCTSARRTQIACKMAESLRSPEEGMDSEDEGKLEAFNLVFTTLWERTAQNRPALLPTLFPAFALLCGDKDDDVMLATIDWSLVS